MRRVIVRLPQRLPAWTGDGTGCSLVENRGGGDPIARVLSQALEERKTGSGKRLPRSRG